jgi:hypothetical protein
VIVRDLVRISHILDLALVVVHQLQQHVARADEIRIIENRRQRRLCSGATASNPILVPRFA